MAAFDSDVFDLDTFDTDPPAPINIDNFKTKIMRQMIRSPLDFRLNTLLGALLHVVGTSDNVIGGQFGKADFLPNDPAGAVI